MNEMNQNVTFDFGADWSDTGYHLKNQYQKG